MVAVGVGVSVAVGTALVTVGGLVVVEVGSGVAWERVALETVCALVFVESLLFVDAQPAKVRALVIDANWRNRRRSIESANNPIKKVLTISHECGRFPVLPNLFLLIGSVQSTTNLGYVLRLSVTYTQMSARPNRIPPSPRGSAGQLLDQAQVWNPLYFTQRMVCHSVPPVPQASDLTGQSVWLTSDGQFVRLPLIDELDTRQLQWP